MNQLATVIWEVKDGGILPFPGNLDDWLYHQRQLGPFDSAGPAASGGPGYAQGERPQERTLTEKDRRRAEAEARNARARREKPLRDEIARIEARIAALELEERETTAALGDPALYEDFAKAKPVVERQAAAKKELALRYAEWEAASARLEALQRAPAARRAVSPRGTRAPSRTTRSRSRASDAA